VDDLVGDPEQQPHQLNHDHKAEEQQRLILILKGSGLGSQIINTLVMALYFQETQNRTAIILDESVYGEYRRNQTVGFWEGFLTPRSPPFVGVLNNLNKRRTENDERILNQIQRDWLHHSVDYRTLQAQARVPRHQDVAAKNPVVVRTVPHLGYKLRRRIQQHYHLLIAKLLPWMPTHWTGSQELYRKLVDFGCPHLRFNRHTRFEVDQFQREYLGSDSPVLKFGSNNSNTTSVAFHIRRGDKISLGWIARVPFYGGESRFFSADSYVDKMLQVMSQDNDDNNNNMPQHCFVASDDYAAVEELRSALQRRHVPCTLHTLTQPTQRGNRRSNYTIAAAAAAAAAASGDQQGGWAKTIHFLAELDLMSRATYFVGTFNSNVASVVALLRGCRCCYDDSTNSFSNNRMASHFAHSYGVDRDFFYLV